VGIHPSAFYCTLNTYYCIVSFHCLFKVSTLDSQFSQPPKDLSQRLGRESTEDVVLSCARAWLSCKWHDCPSHAGKKL